MNPVTELTDLGQSLWLDFIRRDLLENGELETMIETGGIRGVTSNPAIFEQAIAGSDFYNDALRPMAHAGFDVNRIFDVLAIDDIRAAADLFLPLYQQTEAGDGYVSIEVSPLLADDSAGTLKEARRLWELVNRPNVMIKIPATKAGLPAIEQAIAEGINVNVTLIFSLERYAEVMDAYITGLQIRVDRGESVDHIASVASFFVSRIDSAVDALLFPLAEKAGPMGELAGSMIGKTAIASARMAYMQFQAAFGDERFTSLADKGARVQRPLWASTSTKNADFPDTMYVDALIGPDTINTVPPNTLEAFRDHGTAALTIQDDVSELVATEGLLARLGISLADVTEKLEREGVDKFARSFHSLMNTLTTRVQGFQAEIGPLADDVEDAMRVLTEVRFGRRLWDRDASLWSSRMDQADEIRNRLGWLDLPEDMRSKVSALTDFSDSLKKDGFERVLWLGMGGSSLAADVFARTLAFPEGLDLRVLDSTDPGDILAARAWVQMESTLFIVASKSGTTTEPLALLDTLWQEASELFGDSAGDHFAVVTDPGSSLEELARERGFRQVFLTPEMVGGRFAALSEFGLLPAALLDVPVDDVLSGAAHMAMTCGPDREAAINPGLYLGAVMGAAANSGRTIMQLVMDPEIEPLADWVEQLIAESSGKDGKGILPVVGLEPAHGGLPGKDRFIVYLRTDGTQDAYVPAWREAGIPFIVLDVDSDPAGFGSVFLRWEIAIATACHILGVNAFDQPDVQSAKSKTIRLLNEYEKLGALPEPEVLLDSETMRIFGQTDLLVSDSEPDLQKVMDALIDAADASYLALLLFLPRSDELAQRSASIRTRLLEKNGTITTLGYGPRYLHSTGQLHKGGFPGAYLLVTTEPAGDLDIAGRNVPFSILERAQALGDLQSLLALDRRAVLVHLKQSAGINAFLDMLEQAVA